MLASEEEHSLYSQLTGGELTNLHTSDHMMICATQMNLKSWGTHHPTKQWQERSKEERLKLPLSEDETSTLKRLLDAAYTWAQDEEIREAISTIMEDTMEQHKRKAIDHAGEVVVRILRNAKDVAMEDANLPKKTAPPKQEHGLHLPKTIRKARDGHLKERNRCGLHLGIYTHSEMQQVENKLGAALKRIYGLPVNGTPNELTTESKEEYGLGLQPLQAVYAQEIYSGLAEAIQSEEDKGVQMGYGKRERNLQTRIRMSQVSRSTAGLLEQHFQCRGQSEERGKLRMGLQTQTNTLRKLNALNEYGIHVQGTGNHMPTLAKETLPIMRQLADATRVYTNAEMEGTTRRTKYQRKIDDELRDPEEQPMTKGTEKMGTVKVVKETRERQATKGINFTKLLTLFRTYPDLKHLTTADGRKALPLTALRETGGRAHDHNTTQKIQQGMLHLYPYICEEQPNDVKNPGDHGDYHERNRTLEQKYIQRHKIGELEKYTKDTKGMAEIEDWPAQIKKQQAKRRRLELEHRVQVGSFEEEVAQLLIRYSSKAELKQRRRNLQNHWTLPPEMMEAVHSAMGAKTEVFASPLNVHRDTTSYYSQYPRDAVFGAMGSAWEAKWEDLGAYQFNPEYTAEDLHRALKKAIEATKKDKPVLGVGVYPTYAKTPYRKLLNKHMGYRVHELLEVKGDNSPSYRQTTGYKGTTNSPSNAIGT
ncbi:hypothetical protein CYMTET_42808 [Cymbomonas tetramitiformis]|uniref:PCIF1 WW domain-containing protein n=1 Tax=Cymbomonas tetramitiformis TaxID=36881 RepID=A0AAE0C4P7_9CHLO|nr:hypothetical protein CYMTET_42808 [Cymbomonas tetramitiformis]